jgi:hypothetical protein
MYLVTFVSFSLLPIVGLALFWIAVNYGLSKKAQRGRKALLSLAGICIGILLVWIGGRIFLNYDPIARYTVAFQNHRRIKEFIATFSNILEYGLLNNVEFAFWSGLPLYLLFIVGAVRALVKAFQRTATSETGLFISVLLTYGGMNLIGQTRGEVGRLWIFFLPLAAMIAVREASRLFTQSSKGYLYLLYLQLFTAWMAFIFLDSKW